MRRLAALSIVIAACGTGTTPDAGADGWLRIDGAQFFRGAMPGDGDGPAVAVIDLATNAVRAGQLGKPMKGALDPSATAAAIGLEGDRGYWILPAGAPEVASPTFPTFRAQMSFARDLPEGDRAIVVRAVDDEGRFGKERRETLTAKAFGPPDGALVISLAWDANADLDLHVIDPAGNEIFNRDINSTPRPAPGQPVDPEAWKSGGVLDFDSNAQCTIDGRRQENVIWTVPPPAGRYVVRVDTPSLCGETGARWSVRALKDGALLAEAQGASAEVDTRLPHDRGAGVLALEIDVP
jgi:hypothetical protein